MREISRKLNIPLNSINYHIHCLKKQEILVGQSIVRYVRFYISKKISENDKKIFNILRQEVPFQIVIFLLTCPNSSQIDISKKLKKHTSTIAYHINKLTGIVEIISNGTKVNNRLKDKIKILTLLNKYQESFLINSTDFGS